MYFLFITLSIIIALSVLGGLFVSPDEKNFPFALLKSVFFSSVLIVLLYSIIITHFRTINLLLLIPIFSLFYKKEFSLSKGFYKNLLSSYGLSVYGSILFACLLITLFQLYYFDYFNRLYFHGIEVDSSFHVFIAKMISKTGVESIYYPFADAFSDTTVTSISSYHYFDIYFIGLISSVFSGYKAITAFNFIVCPVFIVFAFVSILSVINELRELQWFDFFVVLGLLFFVGFCPLDILSIGNFQFCGQNLFSRTRTFLAVVFLSLLIIHLLRGEYHKMFIYIGMFPVLNHFFYYFDAVLFVFLIFFILFYEKRFRSVHELMKVCLPALVMLPLIFLTYRFFGYSAIESGKVNNFDFSYLLESAKLFLINGIVKVVYFLPVYVFLLIAVWLRFRVLKLIVFIGIVLFLSMLLQSVGHGNFESFQFETYIYFPSIFLIVAILYSQLNFKHYRYNVLFCSLFLFQLCPSLYFLFKNKQTSLILKTNILSIGQNFSSEKSNIVGALVSSPNYKPTFIHSASYLRSITDDTWTYGLDVVNNENSALQFENTNSYYLKFLKENGIDYLHYKVEDQINFMIQNKIYFCLIDKSRLSSFPQSRIMKIWDLTNDISLIKLNR